MRTFFVEDFKINVCQDILEWTKTFYDVPEGAILEEEDRDKVEHMGFSNIDGKEIWVFAPEKWNLFELKQIVAHEVGHIVELKHNLNPAQSDDNDDLHELKADHYMNFFMLVDNIVSQILDMLQAGFDVRVDEIQSSMVLLPRKLTAENGMKGLLSGEFYEEVEVPNPDYDEENWNAEEEEYFSHKIPVKWTTIKEIYNKIVEHFDGSPKDEPVTVQKD